jgi:dihydroxyacetone kinase-like protein
METATLDAATARAWVDGFLAALDDERLALGDLDRQAGDGDYGANLQTAVAKARAALAEGDGSLGAPFTALSSGFMQTGGTSGPLFGMWFRAFAKAGGRATAAPGVAGAAAASEPDGATEPAGANGLAPALDLAALAAAARDGLAAVQRLGRAQVGDKTMVDAMAPAVAALEQAAAVGDSLADALASAARAARAGAERTTELVARRGRASYVGDVARGVVDPGAVTVALLFERFPSA